MIQQRSGTTLRIPVGVSGIPKPTVSWTKDDETLKPQGRLSLDATSTGSTLLVKKVTREDDGMYAILAENEAGETKAAFDVEVTGREFFSVKGRSQKKWCEGQKINLPLHENRVINSNDLRTKKFAFNGLIFLFVSNIKLPRNVLVCFTQFSVSKTSFKDL